MRFALATCLILMGPAAMADNTSLPQVIGQTIDHHILAHHAAFAQTAADLAETARQDCTPAHVTDAYHTAFDAWVAVSHIRFGPIEDNGEGLAVAFWPDKKGMIPKSLARLIQTQDPVVANPAAFAKYSIAARGFFALERLLFDPAFSAYDNNSYSCALTQAITADLSRIATATHTGWADGYASLLRSAGASDNPVFLTEKEGAQALYTNLLGGLEYIEIQRLGRPLGSFEKPRPKRAEARRSTRSLRNIIVSLVALQNMTVILAEGEADETLEAFTSTLNFARSLDDHVFERLDETSAKFQLGTLRELIAVTKEAATVELGVHLQVGAGFNALDGD